MTEWQIPRAGGEILSAAPWWVWALVVAAGVAGLILAARAARRRGRGKAATWITAAATVLGLGWTAQGMWDVAVRHYGQSQQVASVLFLVFEALLVSRMLMAYRYRADRRRRQRFIAAVWVIATVMALVVALGEGWGQAPGRLSIPLLVAYAWYADLTADDDPDERLTTERRWTWREIGLRTGWLRYSAADVADPTEAERRELVIRMSRLQFAEEFGWIWVSMVLRRRIRLAKLKLVADEAMIAEADARVARAQGRKVHPTMPPQPAEPEHVPTPEPTPGAEPESAPAPEPAPAEPPRPAPRRARRTGKPTSRVVDGQTLVGDDLKAYACMMLIDSVSPERPRGMSTAELRDAFDPPLGERTAETWAAEARRRIHSQRLNGNRPDLAPMP